MASSFTLASSAFNPGTIAASALASFNYSDRLATYTLSLFAS